MNRLAKSVLADVPLCSPLPNANSISGFYPARCVTVRHSPFDGMPVAHLRLCAPGVAVRCAACPDSCTGAERRRANEPADRTEPVFFLYTSAGSRLSNDCVGAQRTGWFQMSFPVDGCRGDNLHVTRTARNRADDLEAVDTRQGKVNDGQIDSAM